MNHKSHGSLEVVCGSMFSGKTEELIKRLRRAEYAQQKVWVFKHSLDTRKTVEHINAHSGDKMAAIAIDSPQTLRSYIQQEQAIDVIGIDEIQFFDNTIIALLYECINKGIRIIAAGLDLDFRGIPFGCMPALLSLADSVTKLKAVCMVCGHDSHFTQRLVNGHPAKSSDPVILIGAQECYQARCRSCYSIDTMPTI